jgi:hypothetical protein
MAFIREFYDPDTLDLMTRALREAMQKAADETRSNGHLHVQMANRIMTAVVGGERDFAALKRAALSAVEADQTQDFIVPTQDRKTGGSEHGGSENLSG